jgi:hypothetical protein
MLKETFIQIYEMDLRKVIGEINLYENEADLWNSEAGITNSAGNLALHLIGNINHFFGAVLGRTGYIRERDLEFANKNVSREEIVKKLEDTIEVMKNALGSLSDEDFQKIYPEDFRDMRPKILAVVTYMLSHLNYHLGQINYHRRLLQNK